MCSWPLHCLFLNHVSNTFLFLGFWFSMTVIFLVLRVFVFYCAGFFSLFSTLASYCCFKCASQINLQHEYWTYITAVQLVQMLSSNITTCNIHSSTHNYPPALCTAVCYLVELLIIGHRQLDVPGSYSAFLVVPCRVSCQLQDLSWEERKHTQCVNPSNTQCALRFKLIHFPLCELQDHQEQESNSQDF